MFSMWRGYVYEWEPGGGGRPYQLSRLPSMGARGASGGTRLPVLPARRAWEWDAGSRRTGKVSGRCRDARMRGRPTLGAIGVLSGSAVFNPQAAFADAGGAPSSSTHATPQAAPTLYSSTAAAIEAPTITAVRRRLPGARGA